MNQINTVHANTYSFSKSNFVISHLRLGLPSGLFDSLFNRKPYHEMIVLADVAFWVGDECVKKKNELPGPHSAGPPLANVTFLAFFL
jgi:hypothetical protein